MLAALSAAVPMVLLPVAADQPENARRCAAAAVGVIVDEAHRTPAAVRLALEQVLTDARYAAAAGRVRDEIQAMPEPAALVPVLERLIERSG